MRHGRARRAREPILLPTESISALKILIVKRDKLGDMLLTTPMLRVLREAMPQAEIHLLAAQYNAWVVDGNACIDRRWTFGRVRTGRKIDFGAAFGQVKLYLDLKRQNYDFAIAANGDESPRALARALHASARRTVGYAVDPTWRKKLSDPLLPDKDRHESERMAALLAPLGVAVPATLPAPEFIPPAFALRYADGWLADEKLVPGKYLVLGIGSRIPGRQLAADQILRWTKWARENHGLDTVFMWTPGPASNPLYPGDDDIAQPVLDAGRSYIHPFRGPLKEAIGIIFRARTSMFPDSGLMHFAAASPGGVLGLFADTKVWTSPAQWAPLGSRARCLEADKSVIELGDVAVTEALVSLIN